MSFPVYRVFWDGAEIPGSIRTEPAPADGLTSITLFRIPGEDLAFRRWMDDILRRAMQSGGQVNPDEISKDLLIEQLDGQGNVVSTWKLARCLPTEFQGVQEPGESNAGTAHADARKEERLALLHNPCEAA